MHVGQIKKRPSLFRRFWGRLYTALLMLIVLLLLILLIGGCVVAGIVMDVKQALPDTGKLKVLANAQGTKIYSAEKQLLAVLTVEHREPVPLKDIPRDLINATIAIEDERFYEHQGMDIKGIIRAFWTNLQHKAIKQGGSTITEQLAENVFLSETVRRKDYIRRLKEALLAMQIEDSYSKDEILELYLNEIYYGRGAYGVKAAAKLYFDKPLNKLTLSECALLAGIPNRPSRYSPFENREASLRRRDLVLNMMAEQGFISRAQAGAAKQEEIKFAPVRTFATKRFRAPYFTTYVIDQLKRKFGYDDDQIRRGGMNVYTTVNVSLQAAADEALRHGLAQVEARKASTGALVCIDPWTGHVLALQGGLDFYDPDKSKKPQFNRATQSRRQPGSSFKPYVYAAAMEKGLITPDSRVLDAPLRFKDWTVHNYDGKYRGRITVRKAMALSVNVAAVRILQRVGVEDVIRLAHAMGIQSELQPYLPLALGASGVTVLEHTSAYGCFATGGLRAEPVVIERIESATGEVLYQHEHTDGHAAELRRVLSPQTAEYMKSMLISVVEQGTGRRAKIPGVTCAGKTGTTSNRWDVWYMGFTLNPEVMTGIWIGNNELKEMYRASGGYFCAPVWKEFTAKAVKFIQEERKRTQFKNPTTGETITDTKIEEEPQRVRVRICNDSGLRARKYCPSTHREYFNAEDVPRYCDIHTTALETPPEPSEEVIVTVCGETGKIAGPSCPTRVDKVFQAKNAPTQLCRSHQEPPSTDPTPPTNPEGQNTQGQGNRQ